MIFEKVRFYSPLSKEALVAKLKPKINYIPRMEVGGFGPPKNGKVFEGEVTKDGFKLQRIINYKNSLLPRLYGKFVEKGNGTEILVTIRRNTSASIFMIFWLGFVGLSCIDALNNFSAERFNLFTIFYFLLLIMGCGLVLHAIGETNKAKSALKKILEEEIIVNKVDKRQL